MKTVLFAFFVLLNSFFVNAQIINDYGLKVSLNSSSIKLTDAKNNYIVDPYDFYNGNSINPSLGLFLNTAFTENLIVELELAYTPKGSRNTVDVLITTIEDPDGDGTKTDYTMAIDLRYLELGLNIKPTVKFGKVPAYLIAGVSANYTLNAINVAYKYLEEFLFSYKFGVGCNLIEVINVPVFIEAKYIGDFSYFYNYSYGKLWNKAVQVSIGYNL